MTTENTTSNDAAQAESPKRQIRNRWNGNVIFEAEAATTSELLNKARAADADLSGDDLRGADLRGADLRGADLRGADLRGADLSYANLSYADLRDADLSYANLSDADLSYANLSYANLSYANLSDADLSYANLSDANLRDVTFWQNKNFDKVRNLPRVPTVENLDAKILDVIAANPDALEMARWHTCDTTHCRAGWAIHLAGEAGYVLESFLGPKTAGALIYHASTGNIPDFGASNQSALVDLKACAAKGKETL